MLTTYVLQATAAMSSRVLGAEAISTQHYGDGATASSLSQAMDLIKCALFAIIALLYATICYLAHKLYYRLGKLQKFFGGGKREEDLL